jgi:hypothetical protein
MSLIVMETVSLRLDRSLPKRCGRTGEWHSQVPCGPIRTCPVTSQAVAVPLHPNHAAPIIRTPAIPNARAN